MLLFNTLLLLAGFFALIKGADWFVDGSSALAKIFKVPGLIIGLTIVALGTSAPELAVSTSAALQGSNEIALSNVVGSNIFNLLFILGISAAIHPIAVNTASVYDMIILIAVSMITYVFSMNKKNPDFSGAEANRHTILGFLQINRIKHQNGS